MGTVIGILILVLAVFVVLAVIKAVFWLAVIVVGAIVAAMAWRRWNDRTPASTI